MSTYRPSPFRWALGLLESVPLWLAFTRPELKSSVLHDEPAPSGLGQGMGVKADCGGWVEMLRFSGLLVVMYEMGLKWQWHLWVCEAHLLKSQICGMDRLLGISARSQPLSWKLGERTISYFWLPTCHGC